MTPQLVFMVLGILAFIAAAVLGVLAFTTYRNEDIRAVKDDLSGKSRQRDIEEGGDKRSDRRSSKRKTGDASGVSALYEDASTGARGGRKTRKKAEQKRSGSDRRRKRVDRNKSAAEPADGASGKPSGRKQPKSVEEYQAEYADDTGALTWGAVVPSHSDASSESAASPEPKTSSGDIGDGNESALTTGVNTKPRNIGFSVIRKEISVNSEKVIGEQGR